MKKISFIILLLFISAGFLAGQSFNWNIRGGINIMDSKSSGKDVAILYHAGTQAGIRIANFGFYGELLYSVHENQDGGDPVPYIIPAIVMKGYPRKIFFAEMGGAILKMAGNSSATSGSLNPDGIAYLFAGLGLTVSKVELSFRANLKQSYPVMQVTAAVKIR